MGAALLRALAYLDTPGRPLEKGAPPRPGDMNELGRMEPVGANKTQSKFVPLRN